CSARLDCADAVIETMRTARPQVILPCYGDRIYGQTEDHEMAFAVPWADADDLVAGLRGTHQGGVRYPIPAWLRYTGEFPQTYRRLDEMWEESPRRGGPDGRQPRAGGGGGGETPRPPQGGEG